MIYILYAFISEANHKNLITNFLCKLSPEFQNKIGRYRRWQGAQLSLLGRVLLVKGMEKMNCNFYDFDIKYTSFNKPYFDNCGINFNISHSKDLVICALTNIGCIGVDIEKITSINVSDFKSQMTINEWRSVNKSKDPKYSFFEYWTQKEAVIKAHGEGLSIPLRSFEVQNNKTTIIGSENFFLKKIIIEDDYSCHIALKKPYDHYNCFKDRIKIREVVMGQNGAFD